MHNTVAGGDYNETGGDYKEAGGDYKEAGGDYKVAGGDYKVVGGDYKVAGGEAGGAVWLAQLVERRTAVREVEGSSPRPDQHSGSYM